MPMGYRNLKVWQKAMDCTEAVYKATKSFPKEEAFGLVSQMRRSVISIAANIAEGSGRNHSKEFIHFLSIANGSLRETETHVLIAQRLGYLTDDKTSFLLNMTEEIGKMMNRLIQSQRKNK